MMKNQPKKNQPAGLTLLVTLMVLVILAVVVVQFQLEAALQNRASSYRIERLKCRYAAESGIALGAQIIVQDYNKSLAGDQPLLTSEMPSLLALDEPNRIAEPNDADEFGSFQTTPPGELPWFVVQKKDLVVNGAQVTVEVHDENAKWPLVWILTSPFDRPGSSYIVGSSLEKYAESLGLDENAFANALDLVHFLGKSLSLPPAPVTFTGSGFRMSPKGRKGNWVQMLTEEQYRHKVMGNYARYWYEHFEQRQDDPLLQELNLVPVSFADCVSIWGSFHVNINTAPPELLQSVLQPLGITSRQLKALIDYRNQQPLYSIGRLSEIKELTTLLRNNIQPLLITKSRTFSVHVTARLGRTFCHLISCVHINHRSEAENLALVIRSGD